MNWYSDTSSWALILGVLTPLAVAAVQQPKWSKQMRTIVAAVAAIVVGVVTVLANGGFADATGALGIIALVMVASMSAYKMLWKPTGVAPLIEAKTSRGAHVVTDLPDGEPKAQYVGKRRNDVGEVHWGIPSIVVVVLVVLLLVAIL